MTERMNVARSTFRGNSSSSPIGSVKIFETLLRFLTRSKNISSESAVPERDNSTSRMQILFTADIDKRGVTEGRGTPNVPKAKQNKSNVN